MKSLILVLLLIVTVSAQKTVFNYLIQKDTIWLDSAETHYSKTFNPYQAGVKTVLIEMDDTLHAGFGSDSAVAKIELMQVIQVSDSTVLIMASRAHPDSTTFPFSSKYVLFDSLHVKSMDTSNTFSRVGVKRYTAFRDSVLSYHDNKINAASQTKNGSVYLPIAPDATQMFCLKYTGKAGNQCRAAGSRVITTFISELGTPVYQVK